MLKGAWMWICLLMPAFWLPARIGLFGSEAQLGAKAAQGYLAGGVALLGILLMFGTIEAPQP